MRRGTDTTQGYGHSKGHTMTARILACLFTQYDLWQLNIGLLGWSGVATPPLCVATPDYCLVGWGKGGKRKRVIGELLATSNYRAHAWVHTHG